MMRMLHLFGGLWCCLIVLVVPLQGQENPVPQAQDLFREAMVAARNGDTTVLLQRMEKVVQLRPNHPAMTYVLAKAYMLNSRPEEALRTLQHLAAMGMTTDIAGSEDFQPLKQMEQFGNIVASFERNRLPVSGSSRAFVLPDKSFIPEGIAYDARTRSFFLGSIHKRKIVRVRDGVVEDFLSAQDGLWSAFGMAVDPSRNLLWVCTAAVPQMEVADSSAQGRSFLYAFDLSTRKRVHSYQTQDAVAHSFGDLALAPNGDVYITDVATGVVYRVQVGSDVLTQFIAPGVFPSPQGIVCTPDGSTLLVADYSRGLARIDAKRGTTEFLAYPDDVTVLGIDGLLLYNNDVIAIQNGIVPQRIIRFSLDEHMHRILSARVLEVNNSLFDEPTLGVIAGKELYYAANSQWGAFDKDGKLKNPDALKEPVVLKLPLDR
jgi:hypothetical protein